MFSLRAVGPAPAGDRAQSSSGWSTLKSRPPPAPATRLAYVGSSNWRADQQYSDDMLLRIADDGVHAGLQRVLEAGQAAARPPTRPADVSRTRSSRSPRSRRLNRRPTRAGWNNSDVTLRVAGSDGHPQPDVQRAGAAPRPSCPARRPAAGTSPASTAGYNVQELAVTLAEGRDHRDVLPSEDVQGHKDVEQLRSHRISIDETPPDDRRAPRTTACSGRPTTGWSTRPTSSPRDGLSGLAGLSVSGSSNVLQRRRRHRDRRRLGRPACGEGRCAAARAATRSARRRPTRRATSRPPRPRASCRIRAAGTIREVTADEPGTASSGPTTRR